MRLRRRFDETGSAVRWSEPAPTEPAWRLALRATYPSTIGLTALTALALVLKPQLAALMAGLLAGLGFAAAAGAAQLAWVKLQRR